ncbi:deacetylase EF_0837-like isoform X2 [Acropora palmata]|uniref:deacetylase EF_0837-like isoform X2 n=1 Tax=Acropora palmata TaxID=6131 RepID=UPI003DA125C5
MAAAPFDLIIRNGRVIDPANELNEIADVGVKDKKITSVVPLIEERGQKEFDASGCIVTPGLIDGHVHIYQHVTPLGVNVDETCLARGVTTVVDAGSAGATTFPGLLKGGECDSLNQVDPDLCIKCINQNRDLIVGVKVRLSASVANDGANEEEAFRRALSVTAKNNVPLMTHHTFSTVPVEETNLEQKSLTCPGSLRAGDIYTHCFHGFPSTIINPDTGQIYSDAHNARKRGVLFDMGHGQGSFSWTVAEICAKEGFWPDIISSDLHVGSVDGPAYDLLTVMSKMLHVGMPLIDIIKSVTMTPAAAIGLIDLIGSLSLGRPADITVMRIEKVDFDLEDCHAHLRRIKQRFVPVAVWKDGVRFKTFSAHPFPNTAKFKELASSQDELVIKDNVKQCKKTF